MPALFAALADRQGAEDDELPATGLPRDREKLLSSPFIVSPNYGTRSSSVLALHAGGAGQLEERRFAPDGSVSGESRLAFAWQGGFSGDMLAECG